MSKTDKRGRPKATSPEPDETTGAATPPEAPPATKKITPERIDLAGAPPQPPPNVATAFARIMAKYGQVPAWVAYMVMWTGSKYGTAFPAVNNWTGLKAGETEPKNPQGFAFFANPRIGAMRAAVVIHRLTAGDYRDPAAVVDALAKAFPKIKDSSYQFFYMEG